MQTICMISITKYNDIYHGLLKPILPVLKVKTRFKKWYINKFTFMNKAILFSVLILTIGFFCRVFDGWDIDVFQPKVGQAIWLIAPLIIAFVFHFFSKQKNNWGLQPQLQKSWFWYLLSVVFFPVVFIIITELGIAIGSVEKLKAIWSTTFISAVVIAIPLQFIKNIFEEFVWRGFLFSKLEAQNIFGWKNDLIIGLIWGSWHLPYIDGFTSIYHEMSGYTYIPLFIIGVLATSLIYGEIRRRSDTVWTAIILHTMANAFVNVLFLDQYIALNEGKEWWIAPATDNLGYIFLTIVLGLTLLKLHARNEVL